MKTKMTIKDQKGSAIVEFAIVLSLLVLLVIGAIEFGILYYNKQVITNASREGARAGIIAYGRDDYYKNNNQIEEIVRNYCINHLITFSGSPDLDVDLVVTPDPSDTDRMDPDTFTFEDPFKVTVTYDYDFLVPSLFGLGDILTISATTMMKREASL